MPDVLGTLKVLGLLSTKLFKISAIEDLINSSYLTLTL